MPVPAGYADCSVALKHSLTNRTAYITFGVDPTATDPATVAAAVGVAVRGASGILSRIDNNVTVGPVTARLGTDGSGALVGVDPQVIVGGSGGTSVPANVSVLVHKRTARGGRRGRGRLFMPWWLQTSDCDESGHITASTITFMNTALSVFLAALATGNVPMVILHEPGRTAVPGPDVVTSLTADSLIGTQRRRLGR